MLVPTLPGALAPPESLTALELQLRARLGVPAQARHVLIFGESSHWDPNWLLTSEQYYRLRIRSILEAVFAELGREPRRVFSIESLFFLRLFWERRPELRDVARRLINNGQLRLTGTGITTPDTLLPGTEAILRDYLHGQEWLRAQGIGVEPNVAYLPDAFGHSPALPAILQALGVELAAVTRIDGMYFIGTDLRPRWRFPLPGSSAELLLHKLRTVDFVWQAPDGSQVLCHWNAFTYFQGDKLAYRGIVRWMGLPLLIAWPSARHIARRIESFVEQLQPLARTPYMFCPIGCDFVGPIPNLVRLLDRYNERRFPESGIWAVNAALDDYLQLVGCYRDRLPTLTLDPNPYWMGFYASRPESKYRTNRIACKLELAERLEALTSSAAIAGTAPMDARADERADARADERADGSTVDEGAAENRAADDGGAEARRALRAAWDLVVVSNHHDFITGTSPDRVWHGEQRPWLHEAELLAERALQRLRLGRAEEAASAPRVPPQWRRHGARLEVSTRHYRVVLDEHHGGCLVSWRRADTDEELLSGPANDLVAYRDSGGLWRMGHEYVGGEFQEVERASRHRAQLTARERDGCLELRADLRFAGRRFVRWLWLEEDSPTIRMRLRGAASRRTTITCCFPTVLQAQTLAMDVPGGAIVRPSSKLYAPTFWPFRSFMHLVDATSGHGLAVTACGPACGAWTGAGACEWVALRNVHRERAFRVVPLPAHPATGRDPRQHYFDYAVRWTPQGDYRENGLPLWACRALRAACLSRPAAALSALADGLLTTDRDDVLVTAVKRASRGAGVIVRLSSYAAQPVTISVASLTGPISAAMLCDARERDLAPLEIVQGQARVPIARAVTSVRLLWA